MTLFRPLSSHALDLVKWATDPNPRVGLGYEFFDSRTGGGAAFGEVILFTARSSVGKTTFGLNVVENNQHIPTVMMSLEMAGRFLVSRLAAIHTNEATANIEAALKADGKSIHVNRTVADFPFFSVADKPAMSLKMMGEALDQAEQQWSRKVRLVIIDFLELIGGIPTLSALDKIDQVGRKVKDFARERDLVVLLFHQVGRADGNGSEPLSMTSGRFGGEVSADYVVGAFRPCLRPKISDDEYDAERWKYQLQLLKSRAGGDLAPGGSMHQLNPYTLKISYPYGHIPTPLRLEGLDEEIPTVEVV